MLANVPVMAGQAGSEGLAGLPPTGRPVGGRVQGGTGGTGAAGIGAGTGPGSESEAGDAASALNFAALLAALQGATLWPGPAAAAAPGETPADGEVTVDGGRQVAQPGVLPTESRVADRAAGLAVGGLDPAGVMAPVSRPAAGPEATPSPGAGNAAGTAPLLPAAWGGPATAAWRPGGGAVTPTKDAGVGRASGPAPGGAEGAAAGASGSVPAGQRPAVAGPAPAVSAPVLPDPAAPTPVATTTVTAVPSTAAGTGVANTADGEAAAGAQPGDQVRSAPAGIRPGDQARADPAVTESTARTALGSANDRGRSGPGSAIAGSTAPRTAEPAGAAERAGVMAPARLAKPAAPASAEAPAGPKAAVAPAEPARPEDPARPAAAAGSPLSAAGAGTPGTVATDTAAAAPPPAPAGGTAVPPERLMAAIVRAAARRAESDRYTLSTTLEPRHLGRVEVELEVAAGQLRAHFTVTNPGALEALGAQQDQLRALVAQAGLALAEFQIGLATGDGSGGQRRRQDGPDQGATARAAPSAGAAAARAAPRPADGAIDYRA